MSIDRRLRKIEKISKINETKVIIYQIVITDVVKGDLIYHYEKLEGNKITKLTEEEYKADSQIEIERGNTIIIDEIDFELISNEQLNILIREDKPNEK